MLPGQSQDCLGAKNRRKNSGKSSWGASSSSSLEDCWEIGDKYKSRISRKNCSCPDWSDQVCGQNCWEDCRIWKGDRKNCLSSENCWENSGEKSLSA